MRGNADVTWRIFSIIAIGPISLWMMPWLTMMICNSSTISFAVLAVAKLLCLFSLWTSILARNTQIRRHPRWCDGILLGLLVGICLDMFGPLKTVMFLVFAPLQAPDPLIMAIGSVPAFVSAVNLFRLSAIRMEPRETAKTIPEDVRS